MMASVFILTILSWMFSFRAFFATEKNEAIFYLLLGFIVCIVSFVIFIKMDLVVSDYLFNSSDMSGLKGYFMFLLSMFVSFIQMFNPLMFFFLLCVWVNKE